MKMLWTGSDSLFLVRYPPSTFRHYVYMFLFRLFTRIADRWFVDEHYAVSDKVEKNLRKYVMKKEIFRHIDPPLHKERVQKVKHDGFNVLVFYPFDRPNQKFCQWLYGWDIIEQLSKDYDVMIVDGSFDMTEVYPYVDYYIRPTRHDGQPRILMECYINDIPYYWSKDGKPDINRIREQLEKAKSKKRSTGL